LGDDTGRNGDRTVGGTIVLESLIIPVGTTVKIDTSDMDLGRDGIQGYLPAVILVKGDVDISGTLAINGTYGDSATGVTDDGGDGGVGGPGGGGGAGGGSDDDPGGDQFAGDGGAGFTGGGAGGGDTSQADSSAGDGGDGSGGLGVLAINDVGIVVTSLVTYVAPVLNTATVADEF